MDTEASHVMKSTPSRSTAGFHFINNDASVGSVSDAVSEEDTDQDIPVPEISTPPNSIVSFPEVSIEIQEDFLSRIYEQVAMHFLTFVLRCHVQ